MGLYKVVPPVSGRMGVIWTLASVKDAAIIEFGCMGHMLYARMFARKAGIDNLRLYSTHINETDISMGDTGRLERAVGEILEQGDVNTFFMVASAVPSIIGVDLPVVCQQLSKKYFGARFIPFGCGGFDENVSSGVAHALKVLAETLPQNIDKSKEPTFSIIGSCADLYNFRADCRELVRLVENAFDAKVSCIMTSDTSLSDIEQIGSSHLNLVIRREGVPAAEYLKKRFGTPYLVGRPYGITQTENWLRDIERLGILHAKNNFIDTESQLARQQIAPALPVITRIAKLHPTRMALTIGGHVDVVSGILRYAQDAFSFTKGLCWCECAEHHSEEIPYLDETQLMTALSTLQDGCLMASDAILRLANRCNGIEIGYPDRKWHLSPYDPPLVGFRGAVHLTNTWLNKFSH